MELTIHPREPQDFDRRFNLLLMQADYDANYIKLELEGFIGNLKNLKSKILSFMAESIIKNIDLDTVQDSLAKLNQVEDDPPLVSLRKSKSCA